MSRDRLAYLATKTLDDLYAGILENIDRYRDGDFQDLAESGGWDIRLSVEVDLDPLEDLDPSGTPEAEIENSLLVWRALHELTPALACEDRIWTRLSHAECLEYSRKRWLSDKPDAALANDVAMNQHYEKSIVRGTHPTISLLNPIAWAQFFESIKTGFFKSDKKKE